jgi:hypothetical protein
MIRKVALVNALKESGLVSGGAYDAAEMPAFQPAPPEAYRGVPVEDSAAIEAEVIEPVADASLVRNLIGLREAIGITEHQWKVILAKRGVTIADELTDRQAVALIDKLQTVLDERTAGEILLPDPPAASPAREATPPIGRLPAPEEDITAAEDELREQGR